MLKKICKDCNVEFESLAPQRQRCDQCRLGRTPAAAEVEDEPEIEAAPLEEIPEAMIAEPAPIAAAPVQTMLSIDQVQMLLMEQAKLNAQMMKEFAQELRKPSEAELAKQQKDEPDRLDRIRRSIQAAQKVEEARLAALKVCSDNGHRNGKGRQVI